MKGKLIVFEGTDGSGKATQSRLFVKRLKKQGRKAVLVSFPRYGSFFGRLVRKYLKGSFGSIKSAPLELSALFFSLDRYEFKRDLEKMLASGKIVVCNRYTYSNIAHIPARLASGKKARELMEWVYAVESRMPVPGMKFFLDVPVGLTISLMKTRAVNKGNGTDIHESDSRYLENTRSFYLGIARKEKDWHVIKCAEKSGKKFSLKSRHEIHEAVWQKARQYL